MISAALNGDLDEVKYAEHLIFGLAMPLTCPDVPSEILNPRNTWTDKYAYDQKASDLARAFVSNFKQYSEFANNEILSAEPKAIALV